MNRSSVLKFPFASHDVRIAARGDIQPGNLFFSEDGDLYLCVSVAGEPMLVPFGEKFELASPLEDGLEVRTGGSLIVEFLADPAPTTSGSRYGCAAITEAGIAIVG